MLGFPTFRKYETVDARRSLYFGAIIGRYANFIAGDRITLDGREHRLFRTYPPNSLHDGAKGFDKRIWQVEPLPASGGSVRARLSYTSPDGEEGYPGTLRAGVTYSLSKYGAFAIEYQATTDKPTVVAMTNHLNFNLAGAGSPDGVLGHDLTVNADRYLPTDRTQIPLGRPAPVAGTRSTSVRPRRSARASASRTRSSRSRAATTIIGSSTNGATPHDRSSPRASTIRRAAASSSA